MEIINLILVLAAVVAVVVVALKMMRSKDSSDASPAQKAKDLPAAKAAAKPLAAARRYAKLRGYEVIAPACIASGGMFADLDFILVGAFGLLCVKCVGLGGEIYGSADDDKWLQVLKEKRVQFDNPLKTAAADTRAVRDALFAAKLKSVSVETVCVFTNPHAMLALPRTTGHLTRKDFSALLSKSKYEQDKGVDIAKAAEAVRARLTDKT